MLQNIVYYIVFGFFYLVSRLPYFILYKISDLVGWILYAIVRYRRATVYENIRSSFPEKSEAEVLKLVRKFYRNFTDNWFETIKLISVSRKTFLKRATYDADSILAIQQHGSSVQVLAGHFYNWEYLTNLIALVQPKPLLGVYMPISNKVMERLFNYLRSRTGANMVAAPQLNRAIIPWRNKQYVIGLVADQNPPVPQAAYWVHFLNRPTAFVTGPERNAKVLHQVPVFVEVSQPKRGYYHFHFKPLSESPVDYAEPGLVTKLYTRLLEESIQKSPELYLWSHRRWKHPWRPEYAAQWMDDPQKMPK